MNSSTELPDNIHADLVIDVRRLLQRGLPLNKNPYRDVASRHGVSETDVVRVIEQLNENGLIKRFGLVIHHRELGYLHNGMVVFDIADDQVDVMGDALGGESAVTLCYRRPRRAGWPYNLFCMIHGTDRKQVREAVDQIVKKHKLQGVKYEILFSTQRFKQRGGSYA